MRRAPNPGISFTQSLLQSLIDACDDSLTAAIALAKGIGIVFMLFAMAAVTSTAVGRELSGFKTFIQDHPGSFRAIAEVCRPPDPNDKVRVTEPGKPFCYFVEVKYQRDGFFYREAPTLESLRTTNPVAFFRCGGYFKSEYWNYTYDSLVLEQGNAKGQGLQETLSKLLDQASVIVNLGIFDAHPGQVHWNQNLFRPFTNAYGVSFKGQLISFSNGLPSGIRLETDWSSNVTPWDIEYEFSRSADVPTFMPEQILGYSTREGRRDWQFRIHMLSATVSSELLPKEEFLPTRLGQPSIRVTSSERGKFYQSKSDQKLHSFQPGVPERNHVGAIILISAALSSTVAAIYWSRRRANHSKRGEMD